MYASSSAGSSQPIRNPSGSRGVTDVLMRSFTSSYPSVPDGA